MAGDVAEGAGGMTFGFIVGKFYPPHRGHKHLIETARRQVDRLVVMLAHHPTQTIPGELRRAWLEEIHPDCEIHLVPDELAEDPKEWADFVVKYLGRAPDVVFTSEAYGEPFAGFMGCRHVLVDLERGVVPCSGRKIRAAPLEHLDFLEPCVRGYYVRRVVLIGAESTGKTTMARALAEAYGTAWVPEYGREYWEEKVKGLSMEGPLPGWEEEEFVVIAREQQRREGLAARGANKVLFCDTNAFATGMWFERYMGRRHTEVDAIGGRDAAHMYLLMEPDFPFVQDGFRDGEGIREWMHGRFVETLSGTGVEVVRVRGSMEERMATARGTVERVMRVGGM
jgi:HTH-type transcriptional repressor of NAD biosynthesis genes